MSSKLKQSNGLESKSTNGLLGWYRDLDTWRKIATVALVASIFTIVAAALAFIIWLNNSKLPSINDLARYRPVEAIQIFDKDNKLAVVVSGSEDRQVVALTQISPQMRKAMMAAEDHDFYNHGGINPSSIFRALMKNLRAGKIVEGGSTITQQLVKNVFFGSEQRSINRKIKEFFLAMQVDNRWTKDKILEMYLNQIYFGNQAYGVERAANRYFNKSARDLTLGESAFIAGLVKAPTHLSKPQNRSQALARQVEVLNKLGEYKLATAAEIASAKREKLKFRKFVNPYDKYPFYVSYVMETLRKQLGSEAMQRGLKVYTNLDPAAQLAAEKSLAAGIRRAPHGINQGALVSIRISDGAVLALVGGIGVFEKYQWNRAVSPHTMGSSFKPFVYLTGFMKGLTPESIVLDTPVTVPSGGRAYSPRNFDGAFKGAMTIRQALALSRNVCAVRIAMYTKIGEVIKTARAAGLSSRLEPYIPIALGAAAASPLEMAGAYSTFARGGVRITPQVLRHVDSTDGHTLFSYNASPKRVFQTRPVALLVDAMQTAVQKGTGMLAKLPDRPVAGKTGTSECSRDIWFVGFTPDVCTAVWGGNDHNKRVGARNATGGMYMSTIFKEYMQLYYAQHPTSVKRFNFQVSEDSKLSPQHLKTRPSMEGARSPHLSVRKPKQNHAVQKDSKPQIEPQVAPLARPPLNRIPSLIKGEAEAETGSATPVAELSAPVAGKGEPGKENNKSEIQSAQTSVAASPETEAAE